MQESLENEGDLDNDEMDDNHEGAVLESISAGLIGIAHTSGNGSQGGEGAYEEDVPLLEFVFEKTRFPSPEDREHLAHISGMSLHQITVWVLPKPPLPTGLPRQIKARQARSQDFRRDEGLGDAAREALSKAHPLVKKLNPDPTEHHGTYELPILMQGPPRRSAVPEIIVLDDDTPPEPSTHAVSPGAPLPWSCSDERVELSDYGLLGTAVHKLPTSVEEHTPVPHSDNPLNPPKTLVHAYPAVYEPSQLTSDPFAVAPHAWLRDRRANTRQFIDTTAEAVADILNGFDRMVFSLAADGPAVVLSSPGESHAVLASIYLDSTPALSASEDSGDDPALDEHGDAIVDSLEYHIPYNSEETLRGTRPPFIVSDGSSTSMRSNPFNISATASAVVSMDSLVFARRSRSHACGGTTKGSDVSWDGS
ncbi:hypothetical protein JB92DRAFT_3140122 [Gautieria morchelliformis]|nr:hypothetical protein JB92DRAFT_3140122 [Gautieria morchelliformis]